MEKKKMKLWKKGLILVGIILIIFVVVTLRKFMILSNLENASKDIIGKNNYYTERYTLQGNTVSITKSYNKDANYLTTIEILGSNVPETRKITVYNDNNVQTGIIQTGETKIAILDGNLVGGHIGINAYSNFDMGFWNKLQLSATSRITTEYCADSDCYLVEFVPGWKLWIDKENGLIVRELNGGVVTDYNYKFDVVRDEDIVKPDISDCKIAENNG